MWFTLRQSRAKTAWWGTIVIAISLFLGWFLARPTPATCQRYESRNIGALRCRGCHEPAYKTWQKSAHAKAFLILPMKQRHNPVCLQCHSLGTQSHLQGVQCESCHGGGLFYSRPEVMVDSLLAKATGLKVEKGATACLKCHQQSPKIRKFHYKKMWNKIKHKK